MSVQLVATLPGHTDRAWSLSWSPSTPLLASCSSDKSVRLYSYAPVAALESASPATIKDYTFSFSSAIPTAHSRTVRSLSFSPTGTTLATASFDSTVGIWQRADEAGIEDDENTAEGGAQGEWEALDPLEGHESECKSVAWSFDGRLVASCSRDKSVWIWEVIGPAEFECLAVLMDHTQDVKAVSWHPTEELLASVSYDDTIKLFAADSYDDEWTCISTLSAHTATVWTVSFSPCGGYLCTAGDDLVLKIWGRETLASNPLSNGAEIGEAKPQDGGRMGPWSSGGVRVGYGEKFKWTLRDEIVGAHERTIYSVDWAKGGVSTAAGGLGRMVTAGGDGTINVYQMLTPDADSPSKPRHELITSIEEAHGVSDINHVAWNKLDPVKAAAALRSLEGGDEVDDEEQDMEPTAAAEDGRWAGVENLFASAGDDGIIKVWRVDP